MGGVSDEELLEKDLYDILGISSKATEDEIRLGLNLFNKLFNTKKNTKISSFILSKLFCYVKF